MRSLTCGKLKVFKVKLIPTQMNNDDKRIHVLELKNMLITTPDMA